MLRVSVFFSQNDIGTNPEDVAATNNVSQKIDLVNKATADASLLASPTELVKVLLARNVYVFRKTARDEGKFLEPKMTCDHRSIV